MKKEFSKEIEQFRIIHPTKGIGDANNGCFVFPKGIAVIVSSGEGWDHVSVSRKDRKTPSWEEMLWIKESFFMDTEWAVQYHPAKKDYVDLGINVLHIWRPWTEFPKPPMTMV